MSSWLYGLYVAMDANFRLKLKDQNVTDPEFGPGWAYFVNDEEYKAEIVNHPQPIEVRVQVPLLFWASHHHI